MAEVFVCEELCQSDDCHNFLQLIAEKQHPVEQLQVSRPVFEKLAYGHRTEGLIGIAKTPSRSLAELTLPPNPLVAVLEGVEKPGNVGAVLRSTTPRVSRPCIVTAGATDLYNPNAIRQPGCDIHGAVLFRRSPRPSTGSCSAALWSIRLASMPTPTTPRPISHDPAQSCWEASPKASAIVGAPPTDQASDKLVPIRLPMRGHVDSLNVSAAAVLFYEALHSTNRTRRRSPQREAHDKRPTAAARQ